MSDVPDPIKSLHLTPELLASRSIRYLHEADRSVLQTIRCGVLFLMAFWSGPACRNVRAP